MFCLSPHWTLMQVVFIELNRPIVFPTKTIRWQIAHCIDVHPNLMRWTLTTGIFFKKRNCIFHCCEVVFTCFFRCGGTTVRDLDLVYIVTSFSRWKRSSSYYGVRKRERSDRQLMARSVYVRDLLLGFLLLFYC